MANNKYPKYSEGNILTSEALNRSFDFLHQQVMITRRLMLGNGVLNGLGYSYDVEDKKASITINPGTAITESGLLVELPETRTYSYAKLENRDEYTLVEDKNEKPLKDVTDINQFVLGLKVHFQEVPEQYCTSQSCTMKGTEVLVDVIPYLVRKKDVKSFVKEKTTSAPVLSEQKSVSMGDLVEYPALPIFLKRVARHFEEKRNILMEGLDNFIGVANYVPEVIKSYIKDCENMKKILKGIHFNNLQSHQFHAFADDLLSAFNEFIVAYNSYHNRYDGIETSDHTGNLENKVVLGSVNTANSNEASSRSAFQSVTSALGKNAAETVIQRMFERIKLMINNFDPNLKSSDGPILIPVRSSAKLGDRMIPSYYKESPQFEQYWDAHNESHLSLKKTVEQSDYQQADFLRWTLYGNIETEKGLKKEEVVKKLEAEMANNRIPLFMIEYELAGDRRIYDILNYTDSDKKVSIEQIHVEKAKKLMQEYGYTDKNHKNILLKIYDNIKSKKYDIKSFQSFDSDAIDGLNNVVIDTVDSLKEDFDMEIHKIFEYIILANLANNDPKAFKQIRTFGIDYKGGVDYSSILLLITASKSVIFVMDVPTSSILFNEDWLQQIRKESDSSGTLQLSNDF